VLISFSVDTQRSLLATKIRSVILQHLIRYRPSIATPINQKSLRTTEIAYKLKRVNCKAVQAAPFKLSFEDHVQP
jgi:hypothetical protein